MAPALPKYAAEFAGTFILVFTVGCNNLSSPGSVWAGLSIGCALMVAIYATASVSGGNLNPAVSFALGLAGKKEWPEVAAYATVQLAAGILAGISYTVMFADSVPLAPKSGFVWWQMGAAEAIYTAMLCFVVLNCAASKKNHPDADPNQFFGLAIGFVVVAGAYSAGAISGGCFNPAVAFGIDVSSAGKGFGWCFAYAAFELLGGAVAMLLFRVVRPEEFSPEEPLEPSLTSKVFSEFAGTFMLVLTVTLCIMASSTATGLAAGASLMCMIYALANVSGANFNPAVTLGLFLRGKLALDNAAIYVGTQLIAGLCASFLSSALYNGQKLGAMKPDYQWGAIAVAEIFFTFVLVFVVLSVATTEPTVRMTRHTNFVGLAIGMCIVVGGFAVGKVSGGYLNPAVSIAVSARATDSFFNCAAYSLFELIGGTLAAGIFFLTRPEEYMGGAAAAPLLGK